MACYKDCYEFVLKLSSTKLSCQKTLKELTDYSNSRLWWFCHFDFIEMLLSLPEETGEFKPRDLGSQIKLSKLPVWLFACFNFIFDLFRKLFIKTAIALYAKRDKTKDFSGSKILITSQDVNWRKVRNYSSKQVGKTDVFFDSVLNILEKQENIRVTASYPLIKYIFPLKSALKSLKIFIDKLKTWNISHTPINLYWSGKVFYNEYATSKHFSKIWKILSNDTMFRQLCRLNNTDIYDIVHAKMRFYFRILFPYAIKRIQLAEKMIEKEGFNLVLLNNEYGVFERALLIAAKRKKVPTLAVQHGHIHPLHQGYMYKSDEISPRGLANSPYCPIPDKTAIFGNYFLELLTKTSSYPLDSLVITGQPRYDVINTIKEFCPRNSILKEYGISPDKNVILWTTQCIGLTHQQNLANFNSVRSAMEKLDNCVLIVKLHPRAGDKHVRMVEECLSLPREDIILVPKNSDTLCLINACDIMITHWSTTAIEAVAFDKDLIILNLSKETDKVDFVKQGAAVGVYKAEDLFTAIRKILDKDIDMTEKRDEYIEEYLYRIDGQSSKRVVELITGILKEK